WRTSTRRRSIVTFLPARLSAPSVGEAENVGHRIEPGLAAARPQRRLYGTPSEDLPILRMMRQDNPLRRAGEVDAVLADDGAAAQRGKADIALAAWAGMAVTDAHRMVCQRNRATRCRGLAKQQRGTRGSVHLVTVMHFQDLDVELGVQCRRRLAHKACEEIDAKAHIAGFDD